MANLPADYTIEIRIGFVRNDKKDHFARQDFLSLAVERDLSRIT